jgi:hydrogenase 3 maturation protease
MTPLAKQLRHSLQGAERVAVLAIGSDLRGDDAAGLLAADELEALLSNPQSPVRNPQSAIAVFRGHTAPENLTGAVRKCRPTHVILIDAADMGLPPGAVAVIPWRTAGSDVGASTHKSPLALLATYIEESMAATVVVIGIQPCDTTFGRPCGKAVREGAKQAAIAIAAAILPPPSSQSSS